MEVSNFKAVKSPKKLRPVFCRNKDLGGNAMNCDLLIAFVTCVATVISTIIAVLRYKKENEQKKYRP